MNILTEHFDITDTECYIEFFRGKKYILYKFDNNHKIIEKHTWLI